MYKITDSVTAFYTICLNSSSKSLSPIDPRSIEIINNNWIPGYDLIKSHPKLRGLLLKHFVEVVFPVFFYIVYTDAEEQ